LYIGCHGKPPFRYGHQKDGPWNLIEMTSRRAPPPGVTPQNRWWTRRRLFIGCGLWLRCSRIRRSRISPQLTHRTPWKGGPANPPRKVLEPFLYHESAAPGTQPGVTRLRAGHPGHHGSFSHDTVRYSLFLCHGSSGLLSEPRLA